MRKLLLKWMSMILCFFLIQTTGYATETNDEIERIAKQPSYDGREFNIITPVKDQGSSSLCWAYSIINASEASILKSGIDANVNNSTLSLSPTQIGYARQKRGADPLNNTSGENTGYNWQTKEGSGIHAVNLLSQWCGPVKSGISDSADGWLNSAYLMIDANRYSLNDLSNSPEQRLELKKAIVKYGAVTFSYYNVRERQYYNPSKESSGSGVSHACTIIGWDDNIPASSFEPGGATQNGGWLVKNSYSSLPYFYLSYDNKSSNVFSVSYTPKSEYTYNYFYDFKTDEYSIGAIMPKTYLANVFKAKGETEDKAEILKAVNVGFEGKNVTCEVEVYTNLKEGNAPTSENLVATARENFEYGGFHTIELPQPITIDKDTYFAVAAKITSTDSTKYYIQIAEVESSNSYLGSYYGWSSFTAAPRIKAFTSLVDKVENSIEFTDDKISVTSNELGDKSVIVAEYQNKRLGNLSIIPVKFEKIGTKEIPMPDWYKDGMKIKAMFWDNILSISPLCRSAEIN